MVDALGSGSAEESAGNKENFIGKVEWSRVECDCEICQKGREAASEGGFDADRDFDHPAKIQPLTQYDEYQHILGLNVSTAFSSKWMIFAGHVENIHGSFEENGVEELGDIADLLEGNVYEWREITFTEDEEFTWEEANGGEGATYHIGNLFSDMDNKPRDMLVPVREVDDPDELSELDAEDEAEVDEVDF